MKKFYTRMQSNNGFDIPIYVRKNFLLENNIVKWIINKNNGQVYISFLSDNENKFNDYENDDEIIIFRKVYMNHSIKIPMNVFNYLNCDTYYYIRWIIDENNIRLECFKKPHISDISGIFSSKEVEYNA